MDTWTATHSRNFCTYLNIWYRLWRVMKGQLLGRALHKHFGGGVGGGVSIGLWCRWWCFVSRKETCMYKVLISRGRNSQPGPVHIFMCQLVITQHGLVFPDCSGLSETLSITCIALFSDIRLCECVWSTSICVYDLSPSSPQERQPTHH